MIPTFIKLERHHGPNAIFEFAELYIHRHIDRLQIIDEDVRNFMTNEHFCFDIYQDINDFFIEDWYFSALLLDDQTYEIVALIFERKSEVQRCYYRIAISSERPHQLLEINSFEKGRLFNKFTPHPYEFNRIREIYNHRLHYRDCRYTPSSYVPFTRNEDEDKQVSFALNHPRAILRLSGPTALFDYVSSRINRESLNFSKNSIIKDVKLRSKYEDFEYRLSRLNARQWDVESVILSSDDSIEWVILYHQSDQDINLLLNRDMEIVDVYDDLTFYGETFCFSPASYDRIRSHYRLLLQPLVQEPPSDKASQQTVVTTNDEFEDFKQLFLDQSILVIGPSYIKQQDMEMISSEFGLPSGIIDYAYPDYDKLTGTSFDNIKRSQRRYMGIILGPNPHKVRGLGKYPSLASKFRDDSGFPFTIEAITHTSGKNLKLTKTSFKIAVWKIIRHHLALHHS